MTPAVCSRTSIIRYVLCADILNRVWSGVLYIQVFWTMEAPQIACFEQARRDDTPSTRAVLYYVSIGQDRVVRG